MLTRWGTPPSQPFNRPGKRIEFRPFLGRNCSLTPLNDRVILLKHRVDLYLTLLEDLFFPHLSPRLWGVTEHVLEGAWTLALYWHTPVRTKDNRPGTGVEQRRQTFAELELFLLVEEVEESGSVDDGDVLP